MYLLHEFLMNLEISDTVRHTVQLHLNKDELTFNNPTYARPYVSNIYRKICLQILCNNHACIYACADLKIAWVVRR